jgi:hypothetical protein
MPNRIDLDGLWLIFSSDDAPVRIVTALYGPL